MKCPYCGREVIYSDRFCKCGAELDMVVCPNCGTPNITLATFCGNCGHFLAGAEPYVPPEPEEAEAEEPEETAIPEQESEEPAVPEVEPEEAAEPEPESEEPVVPDEATEEAAEPEPEPEEPVVPEETPEEAVEPEPEPEEPVVPEETPEEAVEPETEQEEPVVPDEETEETYAPEEKTEELSEESFIPEEETEKLPEETAIPEEEPEEAFASEQESEEAAASEESDESAVSEEPEETAPPEEDGGGRRRRGGLIALWIVIAIIVVVVIVLLVWSTRGNKQENTPVENEENLSGTEAGEEEDLTADKNADEEETPAAVSDISFDRKTTEDNQEYAVVTAKDEAGNVVWDYTTPQYAEAELDRVSDIGLHGDSYFLIQDGAVLSLDKATGDTLWENGDYGGSPVDHSWAYGPDGLYLCGYEGPAIYGVSYDGDTLGKIDTFDNLSDVTDINLWPYKIVLSGNEADVYYGPDNVLEEGDKAISENEATVYRVDLNNWEYTLISNGAAKVESTSGNNGNGSNSESGSDNSGSGSGTSSGSGSNGGSGGDSGSGSSGGSDSGSGGSGGSGSGSGDTSGSGSGSNGGSGDTSGSGSGGGSSTPKVSMSNVKDVTASSYLYESRVNISHDPKYLVDGTLNNAWCEDADGDGIGQWAKVEFNGMYTVSGMNINNGYQKSESLYYQNCRPKEITITFSDGSSFDTTLEDVDKEQNVSFPKPVNTSSVTITIRSVYKGSKYEDTCISEVAFY